MNDTPVTLSTAGDKPVENLPHVRTRRRDLMLLYGISEADFDEMLADQHGVCAVCGEPPRDGQRMSIDHHHMTGRIRGIVHISCNLRLGRLERDHLHGGSAIWKGRAMEYLLLGGYPHSRIRRIDSERLAKHHPPIRGDIPNSAKSLGKTVSREQA